MWWCVVCCVLWWIDWWPLCFSNGNFFFGKRKEHPLSLDLGGKNFLHLCGLFVVFGQFVQFGFKIWAYLALNMFSMVDEWDLSGFRRLLGMYTMADFFVDLQIDLFDILRQFLAQFFSSLLDILATLGWNLFFKTSSLGWMTWTIFYATEVGAFRFP